MKKVYIFYLVLALILFPLFILQADPPNNVPSCNTRLLTIQTGWDYNKGDFIPIGSLDPFWVVVKDDDPATSEPRPAYVDNKLGVINSGFFTNTVDNWCCSSSTNACTSSTVGCTAYYPFPYGTAPTGTQVDQPRVFNYTFCIEPGTNLSDLNFDFTFKSDDYAKVCLNGNFIAGCAYLSSPCNVTGANAYLQTGVNIVSVSLYNLRGGITFFGFTGTLSTIGPGNPIIKPNCCAPIKIIAGQKFFDANGNGVKDVNEQGVQSWPINLRNSSGNIIATTQTDVKGNYFFYGLTPDNYWVEEGIKFGFVQTYPPAPGYSANLMTRSIWAGLDFGNAVITSTCCSSPSVSCPALINYANTGINTFSAEICSGVSLNMQAMCSNASYFWWDFGDLTPIVTGVNTSHAYSSAGNYQLILYSQDAACNNTVVVNITVHSPAFCLPCCPTPFVLSGISGFFSFGVTGSPDSYTANACPDVPFNFSIGTCSSAPYYEVDFGDGSPKLLNNMSPAHQFLNAGSYTITISALGNCISKQTIEVINNSTNCPISIPGSCVGDATLSINSSYFPGATTCNWDFGDGGTGIGLTTGHYYKSAGYYPITITVSPGPVVISQKVQILSCEVIESCINCIGSFAPDAGDYIVTMWVREDINPTPDSYINAKFQVSFTGDPTVFTFGTNIAKNRIIDGWQRIEELITVPVTATHVHFKLVNNGGSVNAYFDDIRMHPKDGQMKSYVYDPITLRLSAVLDENNYATFYEYDEEGKLIRVKKETEKGIMTIQENMESLKKE